MDRGERGRERDERERERRRRREEEEEESGGDQPILQVKANFMVRVIIVAPAPEVNCTSTSLQDSLY